MRALLGIDELSDLLGVPKATIYRWRTTGYGPQGFRVARFVKWDPAEVEQWVAEQKDLAQANNSADPNGTGAVTNTTTTTSRKRSRRAT